MGTIFMNTDNSKTNERHKFILKLLQRLDLKCEEKQAALQNFSFYYTWKNIRWLNINTRWFKAIDSNIKQYEEIRKLTTGKGEDYTNGCLLDYDYIKIIIDISSWLK